MTSTESLPRWSTADVHESLDARSFTDALESVGADVTRLTALFDELDVRGGPARRATTDDGHTADRVIDAYNAAADRLAPLRAIAYAAVSTDSRDARAQAVLSELRVIDAQLVPLLARLAEWVHALGVTDLARESSVAAAHAGPLRRLDERAAHQMSESDEALYAELSTTGASAWSRLQADVTSQLTAEVSLPDGRTETLSMPAVRGLATHGDQRVRRAAYDAELRAWPTIATPVAAAMNAIKGDANIVNRRRSWASPLEASLFANSVSRPTFDAMQHAVVDSLPDFRRWMRAKAGLLGHVDGDGAARLPWWDLVAPVPHAADDISWEEGLDVVRRGFEAYDPSLAAIVDRAIDGAWIDASPREGKSGGAFCMPFVDDRSLVLLNWSGSLESAQTTAHELGHAFHNTMLAGRTPLQRRLPMALAETASIFCETLVVEAGLARLQGPDRLALLEVDLQGANQVVVDIHSRFLFEIEVFARRQRRTLSSHELDELMNEAQDQAYGDGLDQTTAHPHMWLLKPHYYSSHFYNWPYTYGLLFGLGLYARFQHDPERFRGSYGDLLSRAGMDTAEQLGASFGIDVTDETFWTASLDVLRARIDDYARIAAGTAGGLDAPVDQTVPEQADDASSGG